MIKPASTSTATKRPRRRVVVLLIVLAVLVGVPIALGEAIRTNDGAPIYDSTASAPPAPVAVVFGAGYNGRALSAVLYDRVMTGVELYKMGKVRKLLMTGDNGRKGYSEPDAMKAAAVRYGVPASDVVCDYAGFHTYDSLYRAREIFGVHRALLVTQTYHLHRALYTGRKLGLDVDGVAAERQTYPDQRIYDAREFLSCVAAWVDVNVTHPMPKYLGKKEADLGG